MKHGIPFIHRINKRSRSVKIHVEHDGTVVVSTPPRFPKMMLPHYVEEARDWIEQEKLRNANAPVLCSSSHVFYFGKQYPIHLTDRMDGAVLIETERIILSPTTSHPKAAMQLLEKWLKNRAIEYCLPRIDTLAKLMNVSYADVRFKQQKSRWGSCSSDKNLNFNWRLVHAPMPVIDYVIIHELAHTVHMDHGRRFWDLVATFDPDHPLHRGWLHRFGSSAL